MQTFRVWLKEQDEDKFGKYIIDFNNFFDEDLNESVINKIKKLYFLKDAVSIVKEFKNIFSIDDKIKITKINIGGHINVNTREIE